MNIGDGENGLEAFLGSSKRPLAALTAQNSQSRQKSAINSENVRRLLARKTTSVNDYGFMFNGRVVVDGDALRVSLPGYPGNSIASKPLSSEAPVTFTCSGRL